MEIFRVKIMTLLVRSEEPPLSLKKSEAKLMDNLPDSASQSELSSWRKWAEKSPPPRKQSDLATGLTPSVWEQMPNSQVRSPYQSCSSCRRIRNR
jgi:hypothetical protein